jgi:serine/threonine protein kinase
VAFYGGDSNHALPPATAYKGGNAAYSSVILTQGKTLSKTQGLSVFETAQVMISVCNAIEKLHAQGKLYLDIKPDNVFLFDKENAETRRVALFDIDTVTAVADLASVSIPFSSGWSPYEQEHQCRNEIYPATDI